ncbi:MAG TPA: hypothetical protein VFI25_00070 [Planctomycetota bacterium]|nr:hypothetical protein [Planctomycetota bacterium]
MTESARGAASGGADPRPLHSLEDVGRFLARRFPEAPRGAFESPVDPDVLTAWLLLAAGDLPDREAFQCLGVLQFERLEDRARARVVRDSYFLHPSEIAADALSRAWRERRLYREGLDVGTFLDDRMAEALEEAVNEGRFGALPETPPGREFTSSQRRWAAEAIRVLNHSPAEKRRVLLAFLFQDFPPERIAEETGETKVFVARTIREALREIHRRTVRPEGTA